MTRSLSTRGYLAFRSLRDAILAPPVALLAGAGVPPWVVSAAGVAAAAGTFRALPEHRGTAFALLAAAVAADLMDGAVARRTGRATAAGKLVDHACDAATFALLCAAVGAAGLAPLPLALGAAVACTVAVGAALRRAARRDPAAFRTDPRAGFWAHLPKLPFAAAYPLALLGLPGLLEPALLLSLGAGLGVPATRFLARVTRPGGALPMGRSRGMQNPKGLL